jgi:transcription initiation factor TFIIH subunit 3
MNAIDGTDRNVQLSETPPPSLLTIIFDTNPHAWAKLSTTLPLSTAVSNLLLFINAHLAFHHGNKVAVLASHSHTVRWLFPPTHTSADFLLDGVGLPGQNEDGRQDDLGSDAANGLGGSTSDANKYPPFARVEGELVRNLRRLASETSSNNLSLTTSTLIAGALTKALTYISKMKLLSSPTDIGLPDTVAGTTSVFDTGDGTAVSRQATLTARILVISVSPDISAQYIPVMNAIFAAQRSSIPIDVLKLAGDTVFLQQASDATGGVYLEPNEPQGLLQYLMVGLMPDPTARNLLVMPKRGEVDFRAACFCHQKVVNTGWVCSVCLSIFCGPPPESICLTCGTHLKLPPGSLTTPAVVPRKKKKKRRTAADVGTGQNTPAGGSTPAPS